LTIDGKLSIEEKTGDTSSIWTNTKGQTWESKQAPGQERQNMTLMGNGNLVYDTNGEKHIVRGNGNEFVEGKGRSTYDFDQDGRVKSLHFPDGRTTFNFDYKGKGNEIVKVSCQDGQTGKVIEAKPDKTWGKPNVEADGSYSQYGYQVQGDQVFMGKQTFHPDGRFEKDTLQPDGKVTTTDGTGKVLSSRLAKSNDFVQPVAAAPDAPASPEKVPPAERRQEKPTDQPEKKSKRQTPGELFEPTLGN
jgi:YD repeat-containing protein